MRAGGAGGGTCECRAELASTGHPRWLWADLSGTAQRLTRVCVGSSQSGPASSNFQIRVPKVLTRRNMYVQWCQWRTYRVNGQAQARSDADNPGDAGSVGDAAETTSRGLGWYVIALTSVGRLVMCTVTLSHPVAERAGGFANCGRRATAVVGLFLADGHAPRFAGQTCSTKHISSLPSLPVPGPSQRPLFLCPIARLPISRYRLKATPSRRAGAGRQARHGAPLRAV